jgi:signal transduction histidine kinase
MAALTEELYSAGHKLFDLQVERLIMLLRVTLAAFSLAAFVVSPGQEDLTTSPVVAILSAYTIFAIVVALISVLTRARTGWQLPVHLVDIGIIALLLFFLEPISSISFLLYTFMLLGATVRWNWRGALWTAISLLSLELILALGLGTFGSNPSALFNASIQGAFILVVGGMFAFFGAARERNQRCLVELAAWPRAIGEMTLNHSIPLDAPLAHIATVLQVPRVLTLWTLSDEPFLHVALWASGKYQYDRKPAAAFGDWIAPPLTKVTFASPDVTTNDFSTSGLVITHSGPLLSKSLQTELNIKSLVSAPFASTHCSGRIFLLDKSHWGEDDLTLIEIVASLMGVELEQYALRLQLADTVALAERNRLARDLHDGVLQGLTAAGLQLKAATSHVGERAKSIINDVIQLLFEEQRRVRLFVEDKKLASEQRSLRRELKYLAEQNARNWGCHVPYTVTPEDSTIRLELVQQLDFILAEAIANAVRHGQASRVEVAVKKSSEHVQLWIKDNGHGVPDRTGVYGEADLAAGNWGPSSLRSRIAKLKGSLVLSSSPQGVELRVELPG